MSEGVLGRLEKAIKEAMRTGILIPAVRRDLLVDVHNELKRKDEEIRSLKNQLDDCVEGSNVYIELDSKEEERLKQLLEAKKDKIIEDALKTLEPFEVRDVVKQQQETIDRQNEEIRALVSGQITLQNHLASVIRKETVEEFSRILVGIIKEYHYWLMDVNNTKDKGMFTIGIEQAISEAAAKLKGVIRNDEK